MPAADPRFLAAYDAVLAHWPVPVEPLDLPSAFGTTHVLACGPEDAPPLVLLHGGGTTAAVWFANVGALSRGRRVYAVDRIGEAGRSVPGDRPPRTVEDLHAWLAEVLDGLGAGAPDVCGHSYGAWLALTFALHSPDRVRRLTLLDPTQCFAGFAPGYLLRAAPLLLRPTAARARAFLAWETGGAAMAPEWPELYGLAAEFGEKMITGRRPTAEALRQLRAPTLVALAGASRVHDAERVAAAARRQLPDVETAVLPGATHHGMPHLGAGELNKLVTAFHSGDIA